MVWHRPGDKPLSEPMMVRLPTHTCAACPQWVNHSKGITMQYWKEIDEISTPKLGVSAVFENGTEHYSEIFIVALNKIATRRNIFRGYETMLYGNIQCRKGTAITIAQWHQPLTLSQWSSSGNPVAIPCAWNSDPSVHWNATGEMPVCFQWCSSGLPVAFQWSSSVFQLCKLTLDRHWDTTGC